VGKELLQERGVFFPARKIPVAPQKQRLFQRPFQAVMALLGIPFS